MLASATQMIGFVVNRRADKSEPLDDTDWMNLDGAHELLSLCLEHEVTAPPAHPLCYAPAGTAIMLRQIIHRASLEPGDMEAIHAAAAILERMRA